MRITLISSICCAFTRSLARKARKDAHHGWRQMMRNISIFYQFPGHLFLYSFFPSCFGRTLSRHQGVTTMLNFFTTSNGFRSTLPVVSNLTAMNIWDGVCMCFIYASLLEFVCVNYVGRKRPLHNVVYRPGENPVTQVNTRYSLLLSTTQSKILTVIIHHQLMYAELSRSRKDKWIEICDSK